MNTITHVEYKETRTFGNYQNVTVGATAAVPADQAPFETLSRLRNWVEVQVLKRVADDERRSAEAYQIECKTAEVERLESKIAEASEKWNRIRAFFARHDIPLPRSFSDDPDLPF